MSSAIPRICNTTISLAKERDAETEPKKIRKKLSRRFYFTFFRDRDTPGKAKSSRGKRKRDLLETRAGDD